MMPAIDVDHITKKFGDFTAVDCISFAVEQGEIFGLLGPNGAGKSTLIRMLTTLIEPTEGTARVGGFDVRDEPNEVRKRIGVIPQATTSDLDLSLEENLLIFAKLYGVPRERRKAQIKELLDAVDLSAWADKPVKFLSGGMRRRLEIARGLVHQPSIFFLDEPTTGLDPVSRVAVWEMLVRLKGERNLTILVTTHYMDEADKLADRIAIVDHGKLVALDTPHRLKASIPGENMLEVSFTGAPPDWQQTLEGLADVASVKLYDQLYRIASRNGPRTTVELVEAARRSGVTVSSLSVQSATLDDVFMHFTGRQLRDELQDAPRFDPSVMYQRGQRN
ncbi:MAG TPA: ATP-binding cassette domain-containing protein [Terriglobia bacterium]|jgi:ABC-2 type transport system ATP-binding protein|nr:ATP-binding cassette domain-containing protein [Terriglobia bacterium]